MCTKDIHYNAISKSKCKKQQQQINLQEKEMGYRNHCTPNVSEYCVVISNDAIAKETKHFDKENKCVKISCWYRLWYLTTSNSEWIYQTCEHGKVV